MPEITRETAAEIARSTLQSLDTASDHMMVLLDDRTIERPFGWVFFYVPKRFAETRDPMYLVPGNAPLIVDRRDGSTHFTGTAESIGTYIAEYEKAHP